MNIEAYKPGPLLQPFVKAYRIIQSSNERVNRVIPNTSHAIAFRLSGQVAYQHGARKTVLPSATISGLRKSARLIHYEPGTKMLIILFTATGATAFFKQQLQELFEESVSLDHYFPAPDIRLLEERFAEADNNESLILLAEQFLASKLIPANTDNLVVASINKIRLSNGMLKIKPLADSLFISQDAFEKRFRKATGVTPKQFSTIVKLESLVQNKPAAPSFFDLAMDYGFYDQAHFNKDFKLFTGLTPTDFFKSASFW